MTGRQHPSAERDFVAVFGGATRWGRRRVPPLARAVAVFGGVELGLTDARFDDAECEPEAVAVFGGAEIPVPEGVAVRGAGAGVFGCSGTGDGLAEVPGAPVLTVKGGRRVREGDHPPCPSSLMTGRQDFRPDPERSGGRCGSFVTRSFRPTCDVFFANLT